jgi:hypothetical protein
VPDPFGNLNEIFAAPIEGIIAALGKGIADAQTALDKASALAQEAIDSDPILSQYGIQAPWYQFPRVDLELKLALSVAEELPGAAPAVGGPAAGITPTLRLIAQPVTAGYQNRFNFDTSASSTVSVSLVPVPHPRGGDQSTVTPVMTSDQVRAAALATGRFATTGTAPNLVPDPTLRFDVNFNASARKWYVLQYSTTDPKRAAVIVIIDDVTGQVAS